MVGEELPDLAWVGLDSRAVAGGNAQLLEPHALRVEHPGDVVIGDDQQRRRIGEWLVGREHLRIDVAVRADQRQRLDAGIEVGGDCPRGGIRIEVSMRVHRGTE